MGDEEKLKIIIEAHNKAQAAFDEANKQIEQTQQKFSSMGDKIDAAGQKMKQVGAKMTKYLTLPILAGAGVSIKAFSDLQETLNKVDVSFGKSSNEVKKWSETSIQKMGLAQQSALDAASLFGDMGTGMGQNQKDAAKMSMGLTQLGADMASFKNVSIDRAQTALAGVYTGETEALKSLGIVMTETNLQEYAASKGITKKLSAMSQAEKVQLRYNFVMDKTKNAQGDFARTSDSIANKTRTASEKTKQLSAELGGKLAPIYNKILEVGTKILDWFGNLSDKWQKWIVYIGLALAVLGPLVSVLGTLATVMGAVFSPIGLIVAAIALLVAALVYCYFHFETFRNVVDTVWNAIVVVVLWAWNNVIKPVWDLIVAIIINVLIPAFNYLWQALKMVWNGIVAVISWAWVNVIKPLWDIIYWYVTSVLIPVWQKIWQVVQAVWNAIVAVIRWAWDNVIKPIWDLIWAYITNVLVPIWQTIFNVAKEVWDGIWGAIQSAWAFIQPIFQAIWDFITNILVPIFQKIWDKVKEVFSGVWDKILWVKDKIVDAFNTVKDNISGLIDKFMGIKDKVTSAFSTVGDAIKAPFKTAFNAVADLWNNTLGKINFTIPDWIPGIGGKKFSMPKIDKLYKGVRNFSGGPAIVGDINGRGGEIVNMPGGTDVFNNKESKNILRNLADGKVGGGGASNTFTGNIYLMNADAVKEFFKQLDKQGEMAAMGVPI